MKGINTIKMNKATVMQAIEEYLHRLLVKPTVTVTDFKSSDYDTFEVEVSEIGPEHFLKPEDKDGIPF